MPGNRPFRSPQIAVMPDGLPRRRPRPRLLSHASRAASTSKRPGMVTDGMGATATATVAVTKIVGTIAGEPRTGAMVGSGTHMAGTIVAEAAGSRRHGAASHGVAAASGAGGSGSPAPILISP